MKRREFVIAAGLLPISGQLVAAMGKTDIMEYTPGLVDSLLSQGKTVLVRFGTDWCSTCNTQQRRIDALMAENDAYKENISFVYVNWDRFSQDPLSQRLAIPGRSVLVLLKGEDELGRVVAGTSKSQIQSLLDQGLKAAAA